MKRRFSVMVLALLGLSLFAVPHAIALGNHVGGCPNGSYTRISASTAGVPAGTDANHNDYVCYKAATPPSYEIDFVDYYPYVIITLEEPGSPASYTDDGKR